MIPVVSVVIPNFNGARFVQPMVEALSRQTAKSEFWEALVVDNGSTDNSIEMLGRYASESPNFAVVGFSDKRGSYAARNFGVKRSRGRILAFTDIDCRPHSNWIAKLIEHQSLFEEHYVVTGAVEFFSKGDRYNVFEWFDACMFLKQELASRKCLGITANLATSRAVFDRLNGFKEFTSGADSDFCRRARLAGFPFRYDRELLVYHPARSSFDEIIAKIDRVAFGLAETAFSSGGRTHRLRVFCRHFVALISQLDALRLLPKVLKRNPLELAFVFRFVCLSVFFGTRIRWRALKSLVKLSSRTERHL